MTFDAKPSARLIWIAGLAVALSAAALCTALLTREVHRNRIVRRRANAPDYSHRRGFPQSAGHMRGQARQDFTPPSDMRTPQALRPWTAEDTIADPAATSKQD